ncbi:MAG: hypothetical protein EOO98_00325 [Pedobacter sp.]|nr:MAG: hypothetical protein EOO98_00325 [Pedobacter sp.]
MKPIRIVIAALVVGFIGCKKPTEDIKIVVDTDIIKHTALIRVTDAQTGAQVPANAVITILGNEAANIYEVSGKKDIKLTQGMVTIGLHPNVVPTAANPISITAEITAPNYTAQRKVITFTLAQRQQVVDIGISRVGNTQPPIVVPPPPVYQDVSLNFTGRCPNRPDVEVRPSVYISFRKSGTTNPFQHLGYMEKGNITTKLLALNETYDFQIVFGGEAYQVSQKIEQSSYNLSIDMPAACNF